MTKKTDILIRGINQQTMTRLQKAADKQCVSRNEFVRGLLNSFDGTQVNADTVMDNHLEKLRDDLLAETTSHIDAKIEKLRSR